MKRKLKALLTFILILTMIFGGTLTANAATTIKLLPKTMWVGETYMAMDLIDYSASSLSASITKISSSDKTVIKVKNDGYSSKIKPIKKGSAKVTYKYQTPDGQTAKASKIYKVKSDPKAIATFTINGKAVKASAKNGYTVTKTVPKNKTIKIVIKGAKGWRVNSYSVSRYRLDVNTMENIDMKSRVIRTSVQTGSSTSGYVVMINSKGETIRYYFNLQ